MAAPARPTSPASGSSCCLSLPISWRPADFNADGRLDISWRPARMFAVWFL
jgi:hypothetical protein